ncbi:MAG TPA: glycerophosphodiester phosphodiesterase family protein, partial [Acidimicrobiales bacterium]|nr:glycerophosphodiester phosphodiesterase family protein [Acidimicrobiales bacterium]
MARHPRLLDIPIGFAHRGASAAAPENTLEAFRLAVELGASGLESDVWVSNDGEAVLDHDGLVGGWLRRRPMGTVLR